MKYPQERNERSTPRLSSEPDPWPSSEWKVAFRRQLLRWFRREARSLPWRETRDPYSIWVSEIMLQQTQVATVIPYYARFLGRFPTVASLAAADESDVLRLWEGLGYYRRARQMHAAAKRIVAEYEGAVPRDAQAMHRLPGIGRYTAGAILSFAFDAREPIVEANTLRLFARLLAFRGDPAAGAGQKLLWSAAEAILPRRGSGVLNQSLMELGSQVCTPRRPGCSRCPVAVLCPTNREGLHDVIPASKPKAKVESVREASVVVRHRGKVLLVQRGPGQRWAGLWDFPRFSLETSGEPNVHRELIESLDRLCNVRIAPGRLLTTLRHGVTRFRITLECHEAQLAPQNRAAAAKRRAIQASPDSNQNAGKKPSATPATNLFADQRWVAPDCLGEFPLSVTGRKIADLIISSNRRSEL